MRSPGSRRSSGTTRRCARPPSPTGSCSPRPTCRARRRGRDRRAPCRASIPARRCSTVVRGDDRAVGALRLRACTTPRASIPTFSAWLADEAVAAAAGMRTHHHRDDITTFCIVRDEPVHAVTLALLLVGAGGELRRRPAAHERHRPRRRAARLPGGDPRRAARLSRAGLARRAGRRRTGARAWSSSATASASRGCAG